MCTYLPPHLTPYHVKCRCSKLLHNALIISIRLLTLASSNRPRAPRDLVVSQCYIFYAKNRRQQNSEKSIIVAEYAVIT